MSLYLSSRAPARRTTRSNVEVPLLVAHLRFFGCTGRVAPWNKTVEQLEAAVGPTTEMMDDFGPNKMETGRVLDTFRARFKTPGARTALDRVQMWAEGLGEDGRARWADLLWDIGLPYM